MRKISLLMIVLTLSFSLVGCKKEEKEEVNEQLIQMDETTYNNIMKYNDYDLGYYIVMEDEKFGLYDEKGEEVLAPVYDFLFPPSNGTIAFVLDDKSGVIDFDGNTVIPADYELVLAGHNGLYAALYRGEWGFINEDNEVVIDFQFDYVDGMSFVTDYGIVVKDGVRFFINREGENVLDTDFFVDIMYGKGVVSNQNNEIYDIDTLELIDNDDRLYYLSRGYQYYATRSSIRNSEHEIVVELKEELGTIFGRSVFGPYVVYKNPDNEKLYYFNLETGETGENLDEYPVRGALIKGEYLYDSIENMFYFPDGTNCTFDDNAYNPLGNGLFFFEKEDTFAVRTCEEEIFETRLFPLTAYEDKLILTKDGKMEVIDVEGNLLFESDMVPAEFHVDFTLEYIIRGEYTAPMFNKAFFNNRLLVTDTEKVYVIDERGELIIDEGFDAIFRTDTILFSILYSHPYMVNFHNRYSFERIYENVGTYVEELDCAKSPFHPDCIED